MRLEARAVSFGYAAHAPVLDSINLYLQGGRIYTLAGGNGAGKTTLIDVLTGFRYPTKGVVYLNETPISRLAPFKLSRLGIVRTFQNNRLFRALSIDENVEVALGTKGSKLLADFGNTSQRNSQGETFQHLAREFNLSGKLHRRASDLSFGEQKLVALAGLLSRGPRFALLDEPLAGLSPSVQRRIVESVRSAASKGCGVLIVEHDLKLLHEELECEQLVLESGKIVSEMAVAH